MSEPRAGAEVTSEMAAELRRLLIRHNLTQLELADRLSNDTGKQFDSGAVSRWLSAAKPVTRVAAEALDRLFAADAGDVFSVLRDRYVVVNDRADSPATTAATLLAEVFGNPRCQADFAARHAPRRRLPIPTGHTLRYLLLSVRDCGEARQLLRGFFGHDHHSEARLISMYDLQGHWDLAVRYSLPDSEDVSEFEAAALAYLTKEKVRGVDDVNEAVDSYRAFTEVRGLTVVSMQRTTGDSPEFLVLDNAEDYDRRRIQRAWIVVDLPSTVGRREVLLDRLMQTTKELPENVVQTIESVTLCDNALVFELMLTCANHMVINQLNREIEEPLSRDWVQKFTMTVYFADEKEWLAHDV